MGWLFRGSNAKKDAPAAPEATEAEAATELKSWHELCSSQEFQGQWVALDECKYDESTGAAREGAVVDADKDLPKLCQRLRDEQRTHCAVMFCSRERTSEPPPASSDDDDPFARSAHR